MPSTRMLAEQFSISRITALLTYERLIAEGYLETLPAKGTFVARGNGVASPDCGAHPSRFPAHRRTDPAGGAGIGMPDPSLFPAGRWRALTRNTLDRFGAQLAREHANGHPTLRGAIAGWLSTSRGLAVDADQVIPVSGRQQALHIAAHLLLIPGARAVVEDPCDSRAIAAFAGAAPAMVRIPVDSDGLCTSQLPSGRVAMAYVTPEHQRPLGVTLSAPRRTALLDWASRSGAVIVEEDCEGELRYHGMDVPPLMSLDRAEQVILIGGFCCSLGPWVTLGFMVVPPRFVAAALAARRAIDDSTGWLEETALADFLLCGGYARHVHRIGKAYATRRDALVGALQRHFGHTTPIWGAGAGLHLAWLPQNLGQAATLARLAAKCGLEAAATGDVSSHAGSTQMVLLGFGCLNEAQIESRTTQFANLLRADGTSGALGAD